MSRIAMNNRRSRPSCSVLALATVMAVGATPAAAQSFNGTGSFASGSGSISTPDALTTNITITSPQTVINWTPTDNATNTNANIVFQNAGTTATFSSTSNFAVLNNIQSASAARAIEMNGTVRARVGGLQQGSVYFYAPGGFVFGGGSSFSVGSLVVSALPIEYSTNGFIANWGTENTVSFGQAVNPNAAIVSAGTIDANVVTSGVPSAANSSYVAMVAPRVQHTGSINVNGSAALVAAEAATISFSPDGLFDIQVTTGTDARDSNGNVMDPITVHGDIGGETPTGAADQHKVYLVAVPKNEAMTMVISQGADLGFTLANNASIDQYGAVVLSAGHDIINGDIGSESAGSGASANFWFTGAHATNNLVGEATGHAHLYSVNSPNQLTTVFDSDVTVHANDEVLMNASGAGTSLTVGGNLSLSTDDFADFGGGSAMGGHTSLYAQDGGSVSVTGNTLLTANGVGGGTESFESDGGDGTGGFVEILALNGGNLQIGGSLDAQANGIGGASYSSGNGGTGTGGSNGVETRGGVSLQVSNATMGITGDVQLSATGHGGRGSGAGNAGGDGIGGDVLVHTDGAGAELTIGGNLELDASGIAFDYKYDYDFSSADGGNGIGGTAEILANGGLIDLFGSTEVLADGIGGHVIGGGNGGTGTGGWAEISANNGAEINGIDVLLSADGTGGDSLNFFEGSPGDGGDAFGGRTGVRANHGSIHITGDLEMDAAVTGGDGANGGDATGIITTNETLPPAAMIWAGSATSEVRVDGLTDIDVSATGGEASVGNGGNAIAGEVDIVSERGHVNLAHLIGTADAHGGNGGFGGGNGGNATGGEIDVAWSLTDSAVVDGTIEIDSAALSVSGFGGDGGDGASGDTGGNGGDGGSGTGGGVGYWGNAAGGTFNVGATTIAANGIGGDGGNGGSGDTGPGGNGGAGGIGTGGAIFAGVISMEFNPGSGGTATFTTLDASADATGGAGGSGGEGGGGIGTGGDGGDAFGGEADFLVRGITVTADSVDLSANATGGNGGAGSTTGNGGDASAGFVVVESKDRFDHPSQRGSLTANSITGTATATGGTGATAGTSTVRGGSYFRVLNGDADIGTLSLVFSGDAYDGTFGPDYIFAQDGAATIGSFTYDTPGDLAVFTTSTGSITATHMTLSAGNFVDYPLEGTLPAPGTLFATNLSVTSGGDFIAHANLDVDNGIDISVPGSIRFNNATSGSFVDLEAQGGSIDIGNVNSASGTSLVADTFIQGGSIVAGGAIFAQSGAGDIDLGALTSSFGSIFIDAAGDVTLAGNALADGDIEIDATGLISMQNGQAGESIDLFADTGSVTALNLTAGDSVLIEAGGAVDVGNLSAGLVDPSISEGAEHMVRIVSGTSIETGNIDSLTHIGLATPGTIDTGDIDAGGIFMALAHGDMNIGDAIADEVFLSDYAVLNFGGITATCIGNCGSLGADGVVTAPPSGPTYSYVTTDDGVDGAGQLEGEGGTTGAPTNGTLYTTSEFEVAAGEALDFWFNYVTSDGSGYADYAWAGLYTANLDPVAILFTARTQPDGTIVPGFNLPGVEATLNPSSVPIIDGGPEWSPLGTDSGSCFSAGCGYTGWVSSSYEIADAGSYVLRFGVTNWNDTGYNSGMAFSGLTVGGVSLTPTLLTRTGGSITIGDVQTGKFSAAAGTSLTTGTINSTGSITLDAGAAILTENLFAGNFVLGNGGSITTQNIEAGSVDMTSTGGNITTLDIDAFGAVALDASGNIQTGDITAGSIDLLAGNDITTDDLTTEVPPVLTESTGITIQELVDGASITLVSGGDINTGNIDSIDGVYAEAGGGISTGTVEANTFVQMQAVGNIQTDDITAFNQIDLESSLGGIATQDLLSTDGDIDLDAFGNISFASADADTEFDFSAGGNVDGGNVVAGNQISGDAGGAVELGNLTVEGALLEGEPFSIGIVAADGISVGNVSGAHGVGFATLGDLSTGNVDAGPLFMALVGGDTTIDGSITTSAEDGGQVYIANASMCEAGGGCDTEGEGDFNPAAVLALDPVMTGGSITINGPVTTGAFRAAAGENFVANAITAPGIEGGETFLNGIQVRAGGTAAINGIWNSGDSGTHVTSNDINITSTGLIDGQWVLLSSTNATQTVVGDGVAGGGYQLSDAEFDRIQASQEVEVRADVGRGAAAKMLLGDLTVSAPGGSEGIEYEFAVLNESDPFDDGQGVGSIRVLGDVLFSGMTSSEHEVNFQTGTFQLDAATGSLALTTNGTALGGSLDLNATHIHVAEGAILDQLAVNPQYTGYQQDLNEAAAVQRPEGVIKAAIINIEFDQASLNTLYVQNTGTTETPAGFLVSDEVFVDNSGDSETGTPNSINLVINGQIETSEGTLTGIAVRDAMVESQEGDLTPFTSNSTINGCPLTGACIVAPPPPPPTVDLVDNFIDLLNGDNLGDSGFGNEEEIDDNDEGDEGADNPISPPQPLFDTRPLIPSGDVNDPVSGTGNPALLGGPPACEEDEQGQCPANPVKGDSQ